MSKDDICHQNLPSWLVGIWKRSYIRRAYPINDNADQNISSGRLGEKDSTVTVRYIQTPSGYFVDIRRPAVIVEGAREGPMAFAGFTSVDFEEDVNKSDCDYRAQSQLQPPLVNWHACIEMDNDEIDCRDRWLEVDTGHPRPTEDQGYFEKEYHEEDEIGAKGDYENHAYRERDPDGTLEELWIRVHDGKGQFLAARRGKDGKALLVIAEKYFGYADQEKRIFVSGHVDVERKSKYGSPRRNLRIDMSAADRSLEGFILPLEDENWTVLPGSTLDIHLFLHTKK